MPATMPEAAFAAWKVGRYFDYTGMHATRRQLSRLGLFDEDAALASDLAGAAATVGSSLIGTSFMLHFGHRLPGEVDVTSGCMGHT